MGSDCHIYYGIRLTAYSLYSIFNQSDWTFTAALFLERCRMYIACLLKLFEAHSTHWMTLAVRGCCYLFIYFFVWDISTIKNSLRSHINAPHALDVFNVYCATLCVYEINADTLCSRLYQTLGVIGSYSL